MRYATPLIMLIIAASPAAIATNDGIVVTANTPEVAVEPRINERVAVRVPNLEYSFEVTTQCLDGHNPESLLVSIADTRRRIKASTLLAENVVSLTMTVPARQIGPFQIESFCVTPADELPSGSASTLVIQGAVSAQFALTCANEEGERVVYATRSLDVALTCDEADDQTAD